MGMKILVAKPFGTGEETGPVVYCDVCDQRVRHASTAMLAWRASEAEELGATTIPVIVHKRECRQQYEAEIGRDEYVDMELTAALAFLNANTRTDLEVIALHLEH